MLAKILCFASGAILGIIIASCCVVAGREDERSGIK